MSGELLKLRAKDAEDVQVISAVLQDSIAPVCDMAFRAADKNFIMVVHRFRHESDKSKETCNERICCAVNIRGVESAQMKGFDLHERGKMLDCLAMMLEGNTLRFVFAGDAAIKLTLGDWSMIIEDFGEPWPTVCEPCHDSEGR